MPWISFSPFRHTFATQSNHSLTNAPGSQADNPSETSLISDRLQYRFAVGGMIVCIFVLHVGDQSAWWFEISMMFFVCCSHLPHTSTHYRPPKISPMPDKLSLKPSIRHSSISPTLSPGLHKLSYKKQLSKNKDTVLLPHLKDAGRFSSNLPHGLSCPNNLALVQLER